MRAMNCDSSECLRQYFRLPLPCDAEALDEEDKALWLLEGNIVRQRSKCKELIEHCPHDELLGQIIQRRTQISLAFEQSLEPWME
jgi:hypothetical protein